MSSSPGEGTNLQALIDEGLPVAAVASNTADARALERAEAAGIATGVFELDDYASREERDGAMADWLAGQGVQLVVCAGYMHLLRPTFLDRFPGRIVNTHSAPLPDFPGAHPIEDARRRRHGDRRDGALRRRRGRHRAGDHGRAGSGPRGRHRRDAAGPVQAVEHRLLPKAVRELIS